MAPLLDRLDRRAILIAMGQAGVLTSANQAEVRRRVPQQLWQLLIQWGMPLSVLEAAGLPAVRLGQPRALTTAQLQEVIDLHLALLGLATVPLRWVTVREAEHLSRLPAWNRALTDQERVLPAVSPWSQLPYTVIRILHQSDNQAWQPLVQLIEQGIYPFGPGLTSTGFMLAEAD